MTWHIVGDQLDGYLEDRVDAPTAASVEAHLVACADCRARLAQRTAATVLAASWQGLERRIDAEPPSATARLLSRLGVSEHHQRLLAPTVPLRLAWLGAIALALGSSAMLAGDIPGGASLGVLTYLTLAAIVPLAAVAASLSTASEPAAEVAAAAPLTAVQVTGLRASAVLVVTATIALVAGVLLPGPWTEAALWLLPSLAMCALTTVLSGRVGPVRSATAVGVTWVCGVGVWVATTHDWLAPFRTGPQLVYLSLAGLAVALVTRRPNLMEPVPARSALRTSRSTS
jgi:anti-sigma factor RsiW